jgi:glycosyltransferase involved in cell wall biosynthesis
MTGKDTIGGRHESLWDGGVAVQGKATTVAPPKETPERNPASHLLLGPDSDRQPVLSVVMPTMNEKEGINTCLDWIEEAVMELGLPTEIIVSDSSTDRTPAIARERGAIVVKPDQQGYGYAYRHAFEHARGEYIVMGDADTTYDFSQIPRLLETLEAKEADMVIGSRLEGEIEDGAMPPLHQYIGNPLLTKFLNGFYDAEVSDAHSGFRVFRRDIMENLDLQTDGMEFASEMIMAAGAHDLDIDEVPIAYHQRVGKETLDSLRDGWRHVRFMLENAPTYLFTLPAIGFSGAGVLIILLALLGITLGGVSFGTHSVIAGSLMCIIGFQVGSLSVFSGVAGDPIKSPRDPLVSWLTRRMQLEHGVAVGLSVAALGGVYVTLMVVRWVSSGFNRLPFVEWNMLAFTAIVLGVQLTFQSFFLRIISGN